MLLPFYDVNLVLAKDADDSFSTQHIYKKFVIAREKLIFESKRHKPSFETCLSLFLPSLSSNEQCYILYFYLT
jgi:hypothetical protein